VGRRHAGGGAVGGSMAAISWFPCLSCLGDNRPIFRFAVIRFGGPGIRGLKRCSTLAQSHEEIIPHNFSPVIDSLGKKSRSTYEFVASPVGERAFYKPHQALIK
jgi:hypothetical protein